MTCHQATSPSPSPSPSPIDHLSIIATGRGFGTYYYDVQQTQACGANFAFQNMGNVHCSLWPALSLAEMDTNYAVAMNNTELSANLKRYCGKRVIVTVNGQESTLPLFIGDGCQRCSRGAETGTWDPNGTPGLDFSYSVLDKLSSAACSSGRVEIEWEILDDVIYDFGSILQ